MEQQDFDFGESLQKLLNLSVADEEQRERAERYGIASQDLCNGMLILMALIDEAKKGNMPAIREIRSLLEACVQEGREVKIIDDIPS